MQPPTDPAVVAIEAAAEAVRSKDRVQDLYTAFVEALIARVQRADAAAADLEVARRFLHTKRIGDGRPDAPERRLTDSLPFDSVDEEVD